jgi:outer membrane protein
MVTRWVLGLVGVCMGVCVGCAWAAPESAWLLRGRLVKPQLTYSPNPGGFSVDQQWMPEVDVSYFFSEHVAAELSLTALKTQTVFRAGESIGTFDKLPPTLLAQYHVTRWPQFKPYVGAGIAHTKTSTLHFDSPSFPVSMNNRSWGPAWQLGVDVPLSPHWSLNLDWKRARFNTDITTPQAVVDTRVSLRTVSMGFGYLY